MTAAKDVPSALMRQTLLDRELVKPIERPVIRMLPDSDEPATYHSALRPQMSRRRVNAAA